MIKLSKTIKAKALLLNEGQLPWLPKNPRSWTRQDLDKMKASLQEDPDFMDDRPVVCCALPGEKGKYVAFAGNLRSCAAKELDKERDVPCIVYQPENNDDRDAIIRRAMKDNGSLGAWDYDLLANEWDAFPLADWGVPAWDFKAEKVNGNADKPTGEVNLADIHPEYHVQVTCATIDDQLKLIAELDSRGYKCKAL